VPTLYVLGAGCSRNYNQCSSPVVGLRPPLDNDFFEMASKVIDHYPLLGYSGPVHGLDHFLRDLNTVYGQSRSEDSIDVLNMKDISLERVMTYYYMRHEIMELGLDFFEPAGARVRTLNNLLAFVITESIMGDTCRKHLRLAKRMGKGDVILNFNYDFLMDDALYNAGKFLDSGYVMRFDYTKIDEEWKRVREGPSQVTMLKLHGSLNWVRCSNCGRNLLLRSEESLSALCNAARVMGEKCPKCRSIWLYGLGRIIVPPFVGKNLKDTDIKYLWNRALDLSEDIERMVVIGYRFSEFDYETDMLLREMIHNQVTSPDVPIDIINPDARSVASRFRSMYRKSPITLFDSLDSYLDS